MYATGVYSQLSQIISAKQFLILHSYYPETAYLLDQGCENPWFFFEVKKVRDQKCLENADVEEDSATFGRTAWKGKRRIRNGRIFQQ